MGSLVLKDNGSFTSSKVYIGGSSDPTHIHSTDGKLWSPSITMIDSNGQFEKGWRLKPDTSNENNASQHTLISNMKLTTLTNGVESMIGTMRCRDIDQLGAKFYAFKVDLIATSNDLDSSSLVIYNIDASLAIGDDFIVTGISSILVNDIVLHAVIHHWSGNQLYYFVVDMTSGINTATRLYTDIEGAEETFFIPGSSLEVIGSTSHFALKSYTVGFANYLASDKPETITDA